MNKFFDLPCTYDQSLIKALVQMRGRDRRHHKDVRLPRPNHSCDSNYCAHSVGHLSRMELSCITNEIVDDLDFLPARIVGESVEPESIVIGDDCIHCVAKYDENFHPKHSASEILLTDDTSICDSFDFDDDESSMSDLPGFEGGFQPRRNLIIAFESSKCQSDNLVQIQGHCGALADAGKELNLFGRPWCFDKTDGSDLQNFLEEINTLPCEDSPAHETKFESQSRLNKNDNLWGSFCDLEFGLLQDDDCISMDDEPQADESSLSELADFDDECSVCSVSLTRIRLNKKSSLSR